jgi:putative ABC transport system permease protein
LSRSTAARRLNMTLVGLFALLALGLAVVGIYGVTAYTVEQRTQEIGVRVALGAARGNVLRLLLVETAAMAGLGIAIGLAGALGATRVLASLLYEVSATDAVTFVLTTVVLGGAALLAALVPALRAARIDPVQALRSE